MQQQERDEGLCETWAESPLLPPKLSMATMTMTMMMALMMMLLLVSVFQETASWRQPTSRAHCGGRSVVTECKKMLILTMMVTTTAATNTATKSRLQKHTLAFQQFSTSVRMREENGCCGRGAVEEQLDRKRRREELSSLGASSCCLLHDALARHLQSCKAAPLLSSTGVIWRWSHSNSWATESV